jgi:sodium-dependent dicarboxylate transporter 2/3/5
MLAIAYSASIGGIATLIGTPPNLILAGVIEKTYGIELSFTQWFVVGFPISLVLLFLCWRYLVGPAFQLKHIEFPGGIDAIKKQHQELGEISFEEKLVLTVFIITAMAWVSRSFLLQRFFPHIDDTIIAMFAAFTLFLLPSSKKGKRLMYWKDAVKLPWGILMLFGGGIAIAAGFQSSGLGLWIAKNMLAMNNVSLILVVLLLVTAVNFLTEITSNLATASVLLPILAPLALAMNVHPYILMVACTLAASCAFMLPVATPPNAIVFGSGQLKISDMIKAGIWMNMLSIIVITLAIYFLLPLVWQIDPETFPINLTKMTN